MRIFYASLPRILSRFGWISLLLLPSALAGQDELCRHAHTIKSTTTAVEDLLNEQTQNQLLTLRDAHAERIEDYFERMQRYMRFLATSLWTQSFSDKLVTAYPEFFQDQTQANERRFRRVLADFYRIDFQQAYLARNPEEYPHPDPLSEALSTNQIALQYFYIATNPNPIGVKDDLTVAGDPSVYSRLHERYHPRLRDFSRQFGVEDVLLINAQSGEVMYSTSKQVDFATSLISGPYAKTHLAEAFHALRDSTNPNETRVFDFTPYLPAADAPRALVAAPVFYKTTKPIAVLVAKISPRRINQFTNHYRAWPKEIFGDTGEVLVIGADHKLRNDARQLVANQKAFLRHQIDLGVPLATLDRIRAQDTTVSWLGVDNTAIRAGLSGVTGIDFYENYQGENVIAAFAPLQIPGLHWTISAEINENVHKHSLERINASLTRALCEETPTPVANKIEKKLPFTVVVAESSPAARPLLNLARDGESLLDLGALRATQITITAAPSPESALTRFAEASADAILIDNARALLDLARSEVPLDIVLVAALHHGHEGILAKQAPLPRGAKVAAVPGTPAHFLLRRYLMQTGQPLASFEFEAADPARLLEIWQQETMQAVAATQHQLRVLQEQQPGTWIFDSRALPLELMQILVVRRSPNTQRISLSLLDTWFRAMAQPGEFPAEFAFTRDGHRALKQIRDQSTLERAMLQLQSFATRGEESLSGWVSYPGQPPGRLHFNDQPLRLWVRD